MTSNDRTIRRISLQLAAEADPSTRTAIIRAVLTDPDAVARSWAVRHFLPEKWKKLPALLQACADSDAKIAALATRALRDWFFNYNQSFAEPTRADSERIEAALRKVETTLPDKAASELRSCLKIYSK